MGSAKKCCYSMILFKVFVKFNKINCEGVFLRKFSAVQPTIKVGSSTSILKNADEISRMHIMPNISW